MPSNDKSTLNRATSPGRKVALSLVVCNYAQAGISFLVSFWLARKLGADEYGLLGYGIVVGQICTIVVGFSSERTLVRDLIQCDDPHAMLSASVVLRSLMAVCVLGYCTVWVLLSEELGRKGIPVLLCSCWGTLSALTARGWLDSHYKMHIHAALLLIEKILYAVSVFVFVTFLFQGNFPIVAATCLLVSRFLILLFEWRYAVQTFRPHWEHLLENLKFLVQQNILVLGAAVANLCMTHANQLQLEHAKGTGTLAYYAIAWQIILLIQLFQSQVVRLLAPRTAQLTSAESLSPTLRTDLLRYMGYMFLASAALILPIVVLAPWVIGLVLDEEFLAAVPILRILSCWALIYGPALVLNQFLLGLRLQKSFFVVTIGAGSLALILGQLYVPKYGAIAVAWVLLVAHGLSILAQLAIVLYRARQIDVSATNSLT